jgi:hypothetical protein
MPALAGNSGSQPAVAVDLVPVCHAGGRGFESRRSLKDLQIIMPCCLFRHRRPPPHFIPRIPRRSPAAAGSRRQSRQGVWPAGFDRVGAGVRYRTARLPTGRSCARDVHLCVEPGLRPWTDAAGKTALASRRAPRPPAPTACASRHAARAGARRREPPIGEEPARRATGLLVWGSQARSRSDGGLASRRQ